ncbi:MAG: hypothetical protein ACRDRK_11040 [Pseudonocardia sp.]
MRDLDLRAQARVRVRADRDADQREHVLPRAQGLDSAGRDLWLYTGRHAALAAACRWLREPGHPATLVVTGDPGSGKSALLSRLTVLADPLRRGRVPGLHLLPDDTVPGAGSITRFVHARGLTAEQLMAALCEATGAEDTTSPGGLLAQLRDRGGPPVVVVVDAVDEAIADPARRAHGRFPVVDEVLGPLITAATRTPLRLMIGTRRHLLAGLGDPHRHTGLAELINLDDGDYADPDSVRRYVESCLLRLTEESAYRHQPRPYLDAVCDAISAAAGRSFLVALITARSLALTPQLVDPLDPHWRARLPTEAADAMREDLDRRLGDQARRARDLLLPLAYAHGSGLPWEDIWPTLARALSDRSYTNADLDWLIDNAGYYITEATSDDGRRSVYRLYHESLAEHLKATRDNAVADEAVIVDTLTMHTPPLADGHPDWDHSHPYLRANLATHAANGDRLGNLLTDPRFMLTADPPQLMAALPAADGVGSVAAADAYRRAAPRLRARPAEHGAAYLQLAARCGRAPGLADTITNRQLPVAWTTPWASWRLQRSHLTASGHTGPVTGVAFGQLDGRPVVVSGSDDQTVRVWDAATGTPVGRPPADRSRPVLIPDCIDLASAVASVDVDPAGQVICGAELGIVCLRLPARH